MSSIVPGYEYDIFISYRQKDNKGDRWVSEFVDALKTELESTFKESVSVYFDINPHDGLLETDDVDASLQEKLKCLIFIPILSRTFCDPKSFAWEHEFKRFVEQALKDQFGLKVKLPNGNVASRVLPVRIHDLDNSDIKLCESVLGGALRGIEFIYKETGVNRSLSPKDNDEKNLNKTYYRNQINKVSLAIKEIVSGLKSGTTSTVNEMTLLSGQSAENKKDERETELKNPIRLNMSKVLSGILVLAVLIVIVVALPKIFKGRTNLKSMTMNLSLMNENGEREIHDVFKKGYVTKLSIFPFGNETNDSLTNWLQYAISEAIWEDLYQFNYISLEQNNSTHFQEQIKYAKTNNFTYFLTGVFKIIDGTYEITSRLYQTSNGVLKEERVFKGIDLFSLIDTISLQTRIALDIPQSILGSFPDLPVKEQLTFNLGAFRCYIEGIYYADLKYSSSLLGLNKAIELDSTFARALYCHAAENYLYQRSYESSLKFINQAMRHRQRLSENDEIETRILYYSINGESDKAVLLSEMQWELHPDNIQILEGLINIYQVNFMVEKCERAAERLNELLPGQPEYMILLANSYLYSGKTDKGLAILEKLLRNNPEHTAALLQMGQLYLYKNDFEAAEKIYNRAMIISPEDKKYWLKIFDHISYTKNNPMNKSSIEQFTGKWRFESGETFAILFVHNNLLIGKGENQMAFIRYPISNNQNTSFDGFSTETYSYNRHGIFTKMINQQRNRSDSAIMWREDSLIRDAIKLFTINNISDAQSAFRKAFKENPEHYYLANYIQHLEFIQSQDYEKSKYLLESCIGKYGELKIYKKNDQFYYVDNRGLIYRILPITDMEFMIPSMYNRKIKLIKEKNSIKGLKFIYRNGKEEFFQKTIE